MQLRQHADGVNLAIDVVRITQNLDKGGDGKLTVRPDELVHGGLTRAVIVAAVGRGRDERIDRVGVARTLTLGALGALEDRASDLLHFALLGHEHVPLILRDGLIEVVRSFVGRITLDDLLKLLHRFRLLVDAKKIDGFLQRVLRQGRTTDYESDGGS